MSESIEDTVTEETKDNRSTILAVDDDESLADLYHFWLNDNWNVWRAYNGEQALERIDNYVDLLLLDRHMPKMNGGEVLQQIRMSDNNVRVIMVTAVDPDTDILQMPFDDYISKPIDKDTIIEAVKHQLKIKEYGETFQEISRTCAQIEVLESNIDKEELKSYPVYREKKKKVTSLRNKQKEMLKELDYFDAASAW